MKLALQNKPFLTYESDIFYHLGLAYCRVEKFEKAIFPYGRCVERIPTDVRYIHERAKAYQMIEMHEQAVADFNVVIKRNPKNAHAFFRRAFSLKSLKVSTVARTKSALEILRGSQRLRKSKGAGSIKF